MSYQPDFELRDVEVTLICNAAVAQEFATNLRRELGPDVQVVIGPHSFRLGARKTSGTAPIVISFTVGVASSLAASAILQAIPSSCKDSGHYTIVIGNENIVGLSLGAAHIVAGALKAHSTPRTDPHPRHHQRAPSAK